MNKTSISIVVPVYNSELSLRDLCQRLTAVLPAVSSQFEIILVDDASRDRSWEVIKELAGKDKRIKGLKLVRNFGQHNALLCGLRKAKHEIIVTLDDDLQNPPEEIPKMIAKLEEGFDVVYGFPQKQQHGFWRDAASQLTKMVLQNSMGVATARNISSFRAFRSYLRCAFEDYSDAFVFIDVLLTWGTSKFTSIAVRHDPRFKGESNYTLRKLLIHAANLITGFSTLPLRLASVIGFIMMLFGVGVFIYVLVRWAIEGSRVPGFPFLASIIAIFSGAQLFSLGIIGEYLSRIHFRSMKKPAYVIRETLE
ncbi:MAG: glycosyltransferase family 2 protein [Candidatus Omnitrophota bacterium]